VLHEALLWLAFQRLPTALYNDRNKEVRGATEYEGLEIDAPGGPLTDEECKRAGIPPDPDFHCLVDESPRPLQTYNDLEPRYGHEEAVRLSARHYALRFRASAVTAAVFFARQRGSNTPSEGQRP
jgi:hypothetical protein